MDQPIHLPTSLTTQILLQGPTKLKRELDIYCSMHTSTYTHIYTHLPAHTHNTYINVIIRIICKLSSAEIKKTGVHSHVNAVRRDNKGSKIF